MIRVFVKISSFFGFEEYINLLHFLLNYFYYLINKINFRLKPNFYSSLFSSSILNLNLLFLSIFKYFKHYFVFIITIVLAKVFCEITKYYYYSFVEMKMKSNAIITYFIIITSIH